MAKVLMVVSRVVSAVLQTVEILVSAVAGMFPLTTTS